MNPGLNPAQVSQRDHHSHRAVTAHAEITDIIEKQDPRRMGRVIGRSKDRPHQDVGSPGFQHDGPAKAIMVRLKTFQLVRHRTVTQFGSTVDDHPRRFPAGVRIDDRCQRLQLHKQEANFSRDGR